MTRQGYIPVLQHVSPGPHTRGILILQLVSPGPHTSGIIILQLVSTGPHTRGILILQLVSPEAQPTLNVSPLAHSNATHRLPRATYEEHSTARLRQVVMFLDDSPPPQHSLREQRWDSHKYLPSIQEAITHLHHSRDGLASRALPISDVMTFVGNHHAEFRL